MSTTATAIRIGFTPDSDDAYNLFALVHGRVHAEGMDFAFSPRCIRELNEKALRAELEVAAVSSAFYPHLADRFWILSCGTSVGRGYGPVLVSREARTIEHLDGKLVGIPGVGTTGATLLRLFAPRAQTIEVPYAKIAPRVASGELEAGVMIHEELLCFESYGLRRVADLGELWCASSGLPLPVGLNVVRKDLGRESAGRICRALVDSFDHARSHHDEAMTYARTFEHGSGAGRSEDHVSMFSNDDTRHMPGDVRAAIPAFFEAMRRSGIIERSPEVEIIEPAQASV